MVEVEVKTKVVNIDRALVEEFDGGGRMERSCPREPELYTSRNAVKNFFRRLKAHILRL